ncbi:MAG: hypothetical protein GY754_26975 [bacterium]|nr:hypothetical protein [bacterium]
MKVKLFMCEQCQGKGIVGDSRANLNGIPEANEAKCNHCNGYGELIKIPEDIVVVRAQ